MGHLFLSHSTEHAREAEELCRLIEAAGVTCWIAPRDIPLGAEYGEAIIRGIRESGAFVLLFGAASARSQHVLKEVERAVNYHVPVLTLRLDDAVPEGSMEYFLSAQQWLECAGLTLEQVAHHVVATVGAAPQTPPDATPAPAPAPPLRQPAADDPASRLPHQVQRYVRQAEEHEQAGDVWEAARCFRDAVRVLELSGASDEEQVRALGERERMNRELADQLRTEYRGSASPALIRVFDEAGEPQGSVTKPEAHSDTGLFHRSALLLVQSGPGRVIYYQRRPQQTYAGMFDFFGGHMADIDESPHDTALREANEELHVSILGRRIRIAPDWVTQLGETDRFVWFAPDDWEKSTLFGVRLPDHPALELRLTDEAADGLQLLNIARYETAPFADLAGAHASGEMEFASGADRVLHGYNSDPALRALIDTWLRVPAAG